MNDKEKHYTLKNVRTELKRSKQRRNRSRQRCRN